MANSSHVTAWPRGVFELNTVMCDSLTARRLAADMFTTVVYVLLLLHSGLAVVVLQSGDQTSHPGHAVSFVCNMGQGVSMGSYTMLWYRQTHCGAPLDFLSKEYDQTTGHFQSSIDTSRNNFSLQITEVLLNDSSTYYCAAMYNNEAYFGNGTKLTVLEPGLNVTKPKVKVLRPSARECGNPKDKARKTIVCVASGFYPDHVGILWNIDGQNVTDRRVATDNAALRVDQYYRITSRLSVLAEEWFTEGKNFTCIVSFFNGKNTESYQSSTIGEKDKRSSMTREKYLMVTQTARFSYIIFIFKSSIYGAFVAFLVWRLQRSAGKQND